jgi:hypothetical protein
MDLDTAFGMLYPPLETLKRFASSKIHKIQSITHSTSDPPHPTNQLSDTVSTMCRWRQSVNPLMDDDSADATL